MDELNIDGIPQEGSETGGPLWVDPSRDQSLRLLGYVGLLGVAMILILEMRTWDDVGDWLLPLGTLTLAAALIVFEIAKICRYLLLEQGDRSHGENAQVGRFTTYKRELIIVSWAVAYPITATLVGFTLATPLFLFLFVWYYERNLKWALLLSIVVSGVFILLFTEVFNVRLYGGIFGLELLNR